MKRWGRIFGRGEEGEGTRRGGGKKEKKKGKNSLISTRRA